jgi:uncharacterized protein (TIGR03085 family)
MIDAATERASLSDLLDEVGPAAPTLCAGWTTRHLAAHLVQRESDAASMPGFVVGPLSGVTERRLNDLTARTPYPDLVERFRTGPHGVTPFRIKPVERAANLVEFFVHHEDVRRAGRDPLPARELPAEFEDRIWKRLRLMSRVFFRHAGCGVKLERETGDSLVVRKGHAIVHIVGRPTEILLWSFGRTRFANVTIVGRTAVVDDLASTLGF